MDWVIIILFILVGIWIYSRVSASSPTFPPLETDPDDPLLLAAIEKARATLSAFRELFEKYPEDVFVKLLFESNTGTIEHLAAHVEGIKGDQLQVQIVTPPVTHKGQLDRNYVCTFDDLEDWQVTDFEGNIYGGFTQRAMFEIARREGVELPQELREMELKYVEN